MLIEGIPIDPRTPYILFRPGAIGCTACQQEQFMEGNAKERIAIIAEFMQAHDHEQ